MKKRKIWAIVFSVIYFIPFLFGGWFIAMAGLADTFFDSVNSLSDNIKNALMLVIYGIIYSIILSIILKLNMKKMVSTTTVIVCGLCLFIILLEIRL